MIIIQKKKDKIKRPKHTPSVKQIDWDKYFGKIHFKQDGLSYQKEVRNEWSK